MKKIICIEKIDTIRTREEALVALPLDVPDYLTGVLLAPLVAKEVRYGVLLLDHAHYLAHLAWYERLFKFKYLLQKTYEKQCNI